MHKLALLPILALAVGAFIYSSQQEEADQPEVVVKEAQKAKPKAFRPEWAPTPSAREFLNGSPLPTECTTPNCQGCALDKATLFRKKPGHPKYQ